MRAEEIRAYIEGMREEGETFTHALGRFAEEVYRTDSTVWRWLSGESKPSRRVLEKILDGKEVEVYV